MNDEQINGLIKSMENPRLIETHISWVLLDKFVYKIKKPLKFSFLDFSTVDMRRFFCEEEIKLNSRLAKNVYLGVVPITEDTKKIALNGKGKIIDYAVKMRKLEQEKMMDRLLVSDKISEKEITKLAKIVVDFHQKVEIVQGGYNSPEMISEQIADLGNFRDAIESASGLGKWVDNILERSARFIKKNKRLLEKRMTEGRIRECHGDLHSGNVFFQEDIIIVDCIEFSKNFRCIDVVSDVAFMAMDLDFFGRHDLSEIFVAEYVKLTRDVELKSLLDFYKCYRANVRAKIAAIEWLQKKTGREKIDRYVLIAEKYSKSLG